MSQIEAIAAVRNELEHGATLQKIRHIARRKFFRTENAEDVEQEVALTALAKAHSLKDPSIAEHWIMGVFRNVVKERVSDAIRDRQRTRPLDIRADDGYAVRDIADARPTPMAKVLSRESHQLASQAFSSLLSREKQILKLCFIDELPQPEVERVMGLNAVSYRNLKSRSKQKLAARVAELRRGDE